jgi:hypothetical protein
MILQKRQDEQVRAQLYRLRAAPDHDSRERGKSAFSPLAIILGVDQVFKKKHDLRWVCMRKFLTNLTS